MIYVKDEIDQIVENLEGSNFDEEEIQKFI